MNERPRVQPLDAVYADIKARQWFYEFDLPNGTRTHSYLQDAVLPIHQTRLDMLWRVLDPIVQQRWDRVTALDVACHQGYFAINLARKGCRSVTGIDARAQHVEDARLMARAYGLDNLRIEQRNVNSDPLEDLGIFDIVVLFGLLYHVENPVGLLRLVRRLTGRACVIETQVAPSTGGTMDWGSRLAQRPIMGNFCVIDEMEETQEPESGLTGISLCPSLDALVWIMKKIGFSTVTVVPAAPTEYEQHVSGARVVVAGLVD
jgi:tRNA (mo5U34)-methyltransferase